MTRFFQVSTSVLLFFSSLVFAAPIDRAVPRVKPGAMFGDVDARAGKVHVYMTREMSEANADALAEVADGTGMVSKAAMDAAAAHIVKVAELALPRRANISSTEACVQYGPGNIYTSYGAYAPPGGFMVYNNFQYQQYQTYQTYPNYNYAVTYRYMPPPQPVVYYQDVYAPARFEYSYRQDVEVYVPQYYYPGAVYRIMYVPMPYAR